MTCSCDPFVVTLLYVVTTQEVDIVLEDADLQRAVAYFLQVNRLDYNDAAANQFTVLRAQKIRIGTRDSRIATIALAAGGACHSQQMNSEAEQLRDVLVLPMPYAVEIRYPDDWYMPTHEDATEAGDAAGQVLHWLEEALPEIFEASDSTE